MSYTIGSLALAAICYYFQIMWMAWIFLGVAALYLLVELMCFGFAAWFCKKIMK